MKRSLNIFFIVFVLLVSFSCKKSFLDVPDEGTIVRQVHVVDLASTNEYLKGVYVTLSVNFYRGYYMIYPDLIADNIKLATAASATMAAQYNWSQYSTTTTGFSNNVNDFWMYGYQIIRSCNFVLEKADEYHGQDPARADEIRAQAYSLRAIVHFMLANVFAQSYNFTSDASHSGIPYVTTSDWTQKVARSSIAEVYDNMINDLNEALGLYKSIPSAKADLLYMNKNAAKALMARIYLFKNDYTQAKNLAKEVTAAVPLLTVAGGYPNNLFKSFAPAQTEILFQLAPSQANVALPDPSSTTQTYTGAYTTLFQGRLFVSPKSFVATGDIAALLTQTASDVRKAWVSVPGTWNITKFPQGVVSTITTASASYYESILRSSEMYLTAAEAYSRINNDDSARYFVNAIRSRAGSPILNLTITGAALLDSICNERRKELAFEGLRMFDLLRWKKGVVRNDSWSAAVKSLPYPSDKAIAPIPETDETIEGLEQNIGY